MKKNLNVEGISNELKGSSAFFKKPASQEADVEPKEENTNNTNSDVMTSQDDIATSQTKTYKKSSINKKALAEIVEVISNLDGNMFTTPIRLSNDEKEYIEEFVYELKKHKLKGNNVSISKLMRYSIWYLMTNHKEEFIESLQKGLLKERKLPIK